MTEYKKKILIIEDDFFLIKVMQKKFEKEQFEVHILENGTNAVTTADKFKPDVILVDLIMPETDGFETIKNLREDDRTVNIPILVVSNLANTEEVEKVEKMNILKYFVKSNIDLKEIIEFIKTI